MKIAAITVLGLAYFFWLAIRREAGKSGKVWLWDFILYTAFAVFFFTPSAWAIMKTAPDIPLRFIIGDVNNSTCEQAKNET